MKGIKMKIELIKHITNLSIKVGIDLINLDTFSVQDLNSIHNFLILLTKTKKNEKTNI